MMRRTRSSVHEDVADLGGRPADDVEPAGGKSRLGLELGEQERRERHLRRGLEHDRAPGRQGRGDLVGDEVEREVERRDRAHDADGDAEREGELADARRGGVHRDHVAGEPARLEGGHREGRDGTLRLHARGLHRLPGLRADRPRDLVVAVGEGSGRAVENRSPLVRRQRVAHRPLGRFHGLPRHVGAGLRDASDERAVVGRAHLDPRARLDPLPGDEELPLGRGGGHAVSVVGHFRALDVPDARVADLCCRRWVKRSSSTPSGRRSGGAAALWPRSARRSLRGRS